MYPFSGTLVFMIHQSESKQGQDSKPPAPSHDECEPLIDRELRKVFTPLKFSWWYVLIVLLLSSAIVVFMFTFTN